MRLNNGGLDHIYVRVANVFTHGLGHHALLVEHLALEHVLQGEGLAEVLEVARLVALQRVHVVGRISAVAALVESRLSDVDETFLVQSGTAEVAVVALGADADAALNLAGAAGVRARVFRQQSLIGLLSNSSFHLLAIHLAEIEGLGLVVKLARVRAGVSEIRIWLNDLFNFKGFIFGLGLLKLPDIAAALG